VIVIWHWYDEESVHVADEGEKDTAPVPLWDQDTMPVGESPATVTVQFVEVPIEMVDELHVGVVVVIVPGLPPTTASPMVCRTAEVGHTPLQLELPAFPLAYVIDKLDTVLVVIVYSAAVLYWVLASIAVQPEP
jgi:hypothetical protein